MKNNFRITIFVLVYCLCINVVFSSEKKVKFLTDPEKIGGYLIEITKAAYEKVGYSVEIEYVPWARALSLVMEGKSEAILGAYFNEERAKKLYYSDVLATSELVFFKLKTSNINYKEISDLKKYKIGVIRDAIFTKEFDEADYLSKDESSDYLTNIKKLFAERVDLVLEKKSVVLSTLKTNFPKDYDKIDYITPALTTIYFYNCFSKSTEGSIEKVKDFNKGLELIKADGTYKKILGKGLHEWFFILY